MLSASTSCGRPPGQMIERVCSRAIQLTDWWSSCRPGDMRKDFFFFFFPSKQGLDKHTWKWEISWRMEQLFPLPWTALWQSCFPLLFWKERKPLLKNKVITKKEAEKTRDAIHKVRAFAKKGWVFQWPFYYPCFFIKLSCFLMRPSHFVMWPWALNILPCVLFCRRQHRHFPNHLQHGDSITLCFLSPSFSILLPSSLPSGPQHFQRWLPGESALQPQPVWLSPLRQKQHGLAELPRAERRWLQQAAEWHYFCLAALWNLYASEDSIFDLRNADSFFPAQQQQDGGIQRPAGILPQLPVSVCHASRKPCLNLLLFTHVWWWPHAAELLQRLLPAQSLQPLWIQFPCFPQAGGEPGETHHLPKHFTLLFSIQWGLWREAIPFHRDGSRDAHDQPSIWQPADGQCLWQQTVWCGPGLLLTDVCAHGLTSCASPWHWKAAGPS